MVIVMVSIDRCKAMLKPYMGVSYSYLSVKGFHSEAAPKQDAFKNTYSFFFAPCDLIAKTQKTSNRMKTTKILMKDGNTLSIPKPESYKDCITLIQSDRFRGSGKILTLRQIIKLLIMSPISNTTMIWFRLCQHKGFWYPLSRIMYKIYSTKYHIDIPITTLIGYGFYIGHGMCIVINGKTIIGNNVNVSQFLNIGTNHNTPAIIGNNVYIGPMVCVVEDVEISNEATIGAGAVVTHDIPEATTAAGVPAKPIKINKRESWFYWQTV